jgi:hypothetical protein
MSGRVTPRSLVILGITILLLLVPLYLLRFIHPAKADTPPAIEPARFHAPVPTPAPKTIIQAAAQKLGLPLPSPSPSFTPHAQATPCQLCRQNVDDYLAAIAAPFPQNRQNVYEAPQVANAPSTLISNAQPVPIFPDNIPANNEFGR